MINQDTVRHLFSYRDGVIYWRGGRGGISKGQKCGKLESYGYLRTKIDGKLYLNHRIIFLYFKGFLPEFVDHKDMNPLNNRIGNLRECSREQNNRNKGAYKNNKSGVKGVCWSKSNKKWLARVGFKGGKIIVGYFDCLDTAEIEIIKARKLIYKKFCSDS